jgi:1-acyl-sn-glycerol-3-phosphate acyltransferase
VADDCPAQERERRRARALAVGSRRSSLVFYRSVRRLVRWILVPWLRASASGATVLDTPGPLLLAPVHRSNLDSVVLAAFARRRIRALGKESLFAVPVLAWVVAALGAIPVRRGEADRDALVAAISLLERGEAMIVFPEGTRQEGDRVGELFTGAAWLSARTGAPIVPIGIAGTGEAMPRGARFLHRSGVRLVVGEALAPPSAPDGRRVGREQIRAHTAELGRRLQSVQDEAIHQRVDRDGSARQS